jgi:hypothetical protein
MDDWFTSPDWRELWLQKVGAYLARYGNDPIVMAWELWNEINACLSSRWEIGRDWTRDMLRHIQPLVPKQMVVNSLGSFDAPESLTPYRDFCMDEMPFQQRTGFGEFFQNLIGRHGGLWGLIAVGVV